MLWYCLEAQRLRADESSDINFGVLELGMHLIFSWFQVETFNTDLKVISKPTRAKIEFQKSLIRNSNTSNATIQLENMQFM